MLTPENACKYNQKAQKYESGAARNAHSGWNIKEKSMKLHTCPPTPDMPIYQPYIKVTEI